MNRIAARCTQIEQEKRIGLMTHVVVGYPTLADTQKLVETMAREGVDFIELQIPFSDPIADGPTILKASQDALDNGTRVQDTFDLAKTLRENGVETPLIAMTYANIVLAQGVETFMNYCVDVGIDGCIIPDLPFDTPEGEMLFQMAKEKGVEIIPLFTPTSSLSRLEFLSSFAKSLVYCVARTGVTGTKTDILSLDTFKSQCRQVTGASLSLGFGIQTPEQIADMREEWDIAIVGSALLRIFEEEGTKGVETFLRSVREVSSFSL